METALQVFRYNGQRVRTIEIDGDVWLVAKDVCRVLGISKYRDVVGKLDTDERMSTKLDTPGGKQSMTVVNEPGLYRLAFRSPKPEAKTFVRWITHEVLPTIRKTGSYTVNNPLSHEELEIRRNSLNLERAKLINSMIENPSFPMTPETRTVFAHEVFKLASGHDYLAMLPESTERWYTAGEIGAEVGLTANKVGRIAKAHGVKAPEGESNEYGRWIFSKSKYSSREVSSFIYSEAGLDWFKDYQRGEVLLELE